jgi:DNA-binding response OmpR family regulator
MTTKVLVVDDELETTRLLSMILQMSGFKTVTALTSRRALQLVKDEHPNAVLLDIMLPEIDGLEICRRLRADPETENLAIVMITASGDPSIEEKGMRAGADQVLRKPVGMETLTSELNTAIKTRKTPKPKVEKVEKVGSATSDKKDVPKTKSPGKDDDLPDTKPLKPPEEKD